MPALAGRKRKMPSEPRQGIKKTDIRQLPVSSTKYSPIAQSVEHMTVNHGVVGSSPTGGAICRVSFDTLFFYYSLLLLIDDIYQKNGIIGIHRAVVERKMSLVPKSAIQI